MQTRASGANDSVGSLIITSVPPWGTLLREEAVYVDTGIWEISVPSAQYCHEHKAALKIVCLFQKV